MPRRPACSGRCIPAAWRPQERARVELNGNRRRARPAPAPPPAAREASRPARVVPVARMTDQMFDRLRELRPTAGTEELRTILNRAGGDFTPPSLLARRVHPPPRPTNRDALVEQVRADRLLGVESAPPPASGCRRSRRTARGPSNLRPENLRVALGLPTVVMGAPVDATPEVIPAARVATDTDAPPPYAVVVVRALSGTGPAAMM